MGHFDPQQTSHKSAHRITTLGYWCLVLRKELEKTYWLCIFGVNQHVSICGTTLGRMDIRVACASSGLLNICPASTFPLCQVLFTYSSCPRIKGQSAGNHRNPYILVLQCLVSCRFFLEPIHWFGRHRKSMDLDVGHWKVVLNFVIAQLDDSEWTIFF